MSYLGYSGSTSNIQKLDTLVFSPGAIYYATVGGSPLLVNSATSVIISVGGVILEPITDYNIVGSRIYFSQEPAPGSSFFGVSLGKSIDIGVPSDNTVTNAKISQAISIAKGGTGATTADGALIALGGQSTGVQIFKAADSVSVRNQLSLGTAALKTAGTLSNNVLLLAENNKLPVLDGSNLTNLPASSTGLGYSQTWQDVLSSRTLGTTYYNATGKPIQVVLQLRTNGGGGGYWVATVGGVSVPGGGIVAGGGDYLGGFHSFIVPVGAGYSATIVAQSGSPQPSAWVELR